MNGLGLEYQEHLHFHVMATLLTLVVQILYFSEDGVLAQEQEDNKTLSLQLTSTTLLY